MLVILPERFQIVNQDSPLMAGVRLLPLLGSTVFGSFLAGAICKRRHLASFGLVLAQCLQGLGVALFLTLRTVETKANAQNAYQVVLGLGIGLSFGSATILTQALLPHAIITIGQAVAATMRAFGGAMAIAVCSTVYNLTTDNRRDHFNPSDMELIKNNPVVQQFLPPHLQELTRQNFVDSFNLDILITFAISVVGLLLSSLVLDYSSLYELYATPGRSSGVILGDAEELHSRDSRERQRSL